MKITGIETLHCDAGWRPWTFIKATTDEGLVGYSECTDSHGSPRGISGCVEDLSPLLIGRDPRAVEARFWDLYRATRQSPGSVIHKAIGGIENALLDVKAKALGVPVYELFGGPLRERIPVYWSHCGTTRVRAAHHAGVPPVRSLKDIAALGREVVRQGFTALKTNILLFGDEPSVYMPGFGGGEGTTDQAVSPKLLSAMEALMGTFRDAVGPETGLSLDLNFNVKTEGARRIAKAMEPFKLMWLEMDSFDPQALAAVRAASTTPICSGENLYGARGFRPFFERQALDVAMVDVPWNGLAQSKKIADLAELHEINVAPHNYYSHLASLISAHFCAAIPNMQILEVDVDDVPWKDALVTAAPKIRDGMLTLPKTPGWGADLNEEVLRAHPWPANARSRAGSSKAPRRRIAGAAR